MSDFQLTEIAPFVEKDARTLRRWCEQGHVPGAYRRPGVRGHWRIRGESRDAVVLAVRQNRPQGARRRLENSYPVRGFFDDVVPPQKTPRQAWRALDKDGALALARDRGMTVRRFMRGDRLWLRRWVNWPPYGVFSIREPSDRWRMLLCIVEQLRAADTGSRRVPAFKRMDWEWVARNTSTTEMDAVIKELTATVRHPDDWQRLGPTALARILGISRRTFYRWFPGWRVAVFGGLAPAPKAVKIGHEEDHGRRGAPIFELVQPDDTPTDADNYNAVG